MELYSSLMQQKVNTTTHPSSPALTAWLPGVMSQTKFVVSKALAQGLKFVVVLNKADRDSARVCGAVETEIFDLLCNMDASDEQLDFPVLYASAKEVPL